MDDKDLILAARAGSHEAMGDLLMRHQGVLRAAAARYLSNHEDIQDVVQDAFVEAFRCLDAFDCEAPLAPWIRSILRHRIFNLLRRRAGARKHLSLVDEALLSLPDDEPVREDEIAALRACLAELSEEHRSLLDLRYREGVAVQTIAARAGKTAASVTMILSRLRSTLSRCIGNRLRPEGA